MRLLAISLCLLLNMTLAAAERGFVPVRRAAGDHVALVIGNGAYPDAPLANPLNDATDVAVAFEAQGFRVQRLLDADKEQMATAIASFREQLGRARAAVFYFAGHGVQVQGENYLLPIGQTASTQITEETQVPHRAIAAGEILDAMDKARVPFNLVVLDACRNNPFKGAGRGRVQGLADLRAPVGSLILYATAAGRTAADGTGRNSPFTSAFLRHLVTPGLDVRLLPSEITNTVSEVTGGAQTPWNSGSLRQGFYFVPPMSESEKFEAEKARKTAELQQAEMQDRLTQLAAQARQADATQRQQMAEERTRLEAALANSQRDAAAIAAQLDADIGAAREREQAELRAAQTKENTVLTAKQAEIAALDAKIAAMKAANAQPGAGADADLDALMAVMHERKTRKAELQRLEQEAAAKRAKAAADAAEVRRREEEAAAARRTKAEAEAAAKRKSAADAEQAKAAELAQLQSAERQALAGRLERDLVKYRAMASDADGKDLAPTAWAKICAIYKVGDVKQGDEGELVERVLPGIRGAARRQAPWARDVGTDASGPWATVVVGGQTQVLRLIPAGTFQMGSEANGDEKSVHQVTISQPFWLGDSEVTQGLWQAVMGNNPSTFTGDANCPVEQVSWDDCHSFLQKFNGQVRGLRAGLPTEAQWEYACRAGTAGDYAGDLNAMAWYDANAGGTRHPVKGKQANAFGLYDMHGNVWELCADWYADSYAAGSQRDPTGPSSGSYRVHRGGGWGDGAGGCRSANRSRSTPGYRDTNLGFRIAAHATP